MAGKKWLVEPSVAPTVTVPGFALASASIAFASFHGVLGAAVRIEGVAVTRQIG